MNDDNFTVVLDRVCKAIGSDKPIEMARELGVTPQSVSHFKKQKKFPPDLIIKYCFKNGRYQSF